MTLDNTTHELPRAIHIPSAIWSRTLQHLAATLPYEGCGLLSGSRNEQGDWYVRDFFPGTNVLESTTRFRMADREVIQALIAFREDGQHLAAIVHSHPSSPPTLSQTDVNEAHYPDAVLIIVSFQGERPAAVAWLRYGEERAAYREIALHVLNSH